MIPLDDVDEQISNNYNLEIRINELRRCLVRYDMVEVFFILQFPSPLLGISHPLLDRLNILTQWDSISDDTIFAHIHFL